MSEIIFPKTDKPVERINLDTIVGKRYEMGAMKNMISDKFQVINNTVDPSTAKQLEKLLAGKQTDVVALNDGSTAKLVILNKPESGPHIHQMDVRAQLTLGKTYLGHTFTEQDKHYLQKYGDMGRPVQLISPTTGQPFKALIGVDQDTNRLKLLNIDTFRVPDEINGKKLSPVQKMMLLEGKALKLDNMIYQGKTFSAYTRLSASKGGFKYNKIVEQQSTQTVQVVQPKLPAQQPGPQPGKPAPAANQKASEAKQPPVNKVKSKLRP